MHADEAKYRKREAKGKRRQMKGALLKTVRVKENSAVKLQREGKTSTRKGANHMTVLISTIIVRTEDLERKMFRVSSLSLYCDSVIAHLKTWL